MGALAAAGEPSLVRADPQSPRGWRSRTYAQRGPALSLALEVTAPQVCFWTFFGHPADSIETSASLLTILTLSEPISLDLLEIFQTQTSPTNLS
jgi:hypothetical protein